MTCNAPVRHTVALVLCWIALAGCDSIAPSLSRPPSERPEDFSSTLVPGAGSQAARPATVQVLKEHFRIDLENSTALKLRTQPQPTTAQGESDTPGMHEMLIGRPAQRREFAVVELTERGSDTLIRCQVKIERRQRAERRTAFAPQAGGDDRPAERTAAERASMSDVREQDRWVNDGRDRRLEQTILNQIAERLGRSAGPRPVPTTATRPVAP